MGRARDLLFGTASRCGSDWLRRSRWALSAFLFLPTRRRTLFGFGAAFAFVRAAVVAFDRAF